VSTVFFSEHPTRMSEGEERHGEEKESDKTERGKSQRRRECMPPTSYEPPASGRASAVGVTNRSGPRKLVPVACQAVYAFCGGQHTDFAGNWACFAGAIGTCPTPYWFPQKLIGKMVKFYTGLLVGWNVEGLMTLL
jgi:hypothetical protein